MASQELRDLIGRRPKSRDEKSEDTRVKAGGKRGESFEAQLKREGVIKKRKKKRKPGGLTEKLIGNRDRINKLAEEGL